MRDDFDGRGALVTGAGSGIGEACAVMLAERGARVVVADIDSAAGERVAAAIGETATPFTVDISDPASARRWLLPPSTRSVGWMWPSPTPGSPARPRRRASTRWTVGAR